MNAQTDNNPKTFPRAIVPVFAMEEVGQPVNIFDGQLTIRGSDGDSVTQPGRVVLEWNPRPVIRYQYDNNVLSFGSKPEHVTVDTTREGLKFNAFGGLIAMNVAINSLADFKYQGIVTTTASERPRESTRILLHLVNFPYFLGQSIRFENRTGEKLLAGRLEMASDKWRLIIDATAAEDRLSKELPKLGSYAITHVAELTKVDGGDVSALEAETMLKALVSFLGLLKGLWCGPILAVHEVDGREAWIDALLRRTSRWSVVSNWFPPSNINVAGQFDALFSNFMGLWSDPLWEATLEQAIYWYVQANESSSIEPELILKCTAFQLLFWTYFVEAKQTVSRSQAKGKGTYGQLHQQLRMLLSEAGIDEMIPADLANLAALRATPNKPFDGPTVISEIRNKIVHPKVSSAQVSLTPRAKVEASRLATIYLEDILLYILGYSGPKNPHRHSGTFIA